MLAVKHRRRERRSSVKIAATKLPWQQRDYCGRCCLVGGGGQKQHAQAISSVQRLSWNGTVMATGSDTCS